MERLLGLADNPRRWWVKTRGRANGRRKEEQWGAVTERILSDMPARRPHGSGLLLAQTVRLDHRFD